MKKILTFLIFAACMTFPVSAQSSGPTAPPPPVCSSSNAGAIYTNTSTAPPTVYTCSYYNLAWQWVVNPSYGGLVYYPTLPTTCAGSLPVFLSGWPTTQMYMCQSGVPQPISSQTGLTQLTGDVEVGPGTGSQVATVKGLNSIVFCTGFTPTGGQVVTLSTSDTPNPCWKAETPTSSMIYPSVGVANSSGSSGPWSASYNSGNPIPLFSGGTGANTSQGAATNIVDGNAINPSTIGATVPATLVSIVKTNATNENPLNVTATTSTSTGPMAAVGVLTNVNSPGVFGISGISDTCVNEVHGAICYALSVQAIDNTDGLGYAHTVGINPVIKQTTLTQTPGVTGSDYYGVAAGMELSPGIWPGAMFRAEGPDSLSYGQIAVAYDMTSGMTPIALMARPGCRNSNCNSASVSFQGKNGGVINGTNNIFADYLNNLRFNSPADVMVDPIGENTATSTNNYNSSALDLVASAWNGTSESFYAWRIIHNVNSSGTISADQLVFQKPVGASFSTFDTNADMHATSFGIYGAPGGSYLKADNSGYGTPATTPVYSTAGTALTSPHIVYFNGSFSAGMANVSFSGAAAFSSASTMSCSANDTSGFSSPVQIIKGTTSITLVGPGTDGFTGMCIGQ